MFLWSTSHRCLISCSFPDRPMRPLWTLRLSVLPTGRPRSPWSSCFFSSSSSPSWPSHTCCGTWTLATTASSIAWPTNVSRWSRLFFFFLTVLVEEVGDVRPMLALAGQRVHVVFFSTFCFFCSVYGKIARACTAAEHHSFLACLFFFFFPSMLALTFLFPLKILCGTVGLLFARLGVFTVIFRRMTIFCFAWQGKPLHCLRTQAPIVTGSATVAKTTFEQKWNAKGRVLRRARTVRQREWEGGWTILKESLSWPVIHTL